MSAALRSRSPWQALRSKIQLERRLRPFQRFGRFVRFTRPLAARLKHRWRTMFNDGSIGEKPASGGTIIAVVGCDGSGKSTLVYELKKWLGRNYAVQTYHLGKPRQSPRSYIVLTFAVLLHKLSIRVDSARPAFLADLASVLSQLCVARDRRREYLKIRRAVGQGRIAIVDRFPLRGVNMDSMSSIIQHAESKNVLLRWLTGRTARYYRAFTAPDLLFVLQVSLDVARARRPGDDEAYLMRRLEAVRSIVPSQNVVMLDGEKELKEVLMEAKTAVWRWL